MRRKDREMDSGSAKKALEKGSFGVLSVLGTDGFPYGIPVNYVVRDGFIYIHCAKEGKKLSDIASYPKVSFTVVTRSDILSDKFSTDYESVVVFGEAAEYIGEDKGGILFEFIRKYSREYLDEGSQYVERMKNATSLISVSIDRLTGKRKKGKSE
ncbi:MAG: pyridoxamine 5'-phosphate oxidase family protein [Youngiibacter sp.]|nr:pyridoxamine 5'-phosphate oxidase family protein [Youngiibacter sp.]